ncbi:hypothetical protein MRI28_19925 [Nocardiopsis dassonvillei]|uniref:hypothetical protein n=1 Tax=Nocardiopsis dassonvillei TaxID=2014 RepID=UPI00200EFF4F|nr:hypothetical protein [Nocardiopsis dassonvillei]MCK9871878.1 hypothetical protein [Nocardiopsis dassonvillei]
MEFLFEEDDEAGEEHTGPEVSGQAPGSFTVGTDGLSVHEPSFPARVAAFLRFSPVIEAMQAAQRRGWPEDTYDIVTLALAAIDLVVSRQGFELEATRGDVIQALSQLAEVAAPDRSPDEHSDVAVFVVDSLLNRSARQVPFRYVTSDYSSPDLVHRQREVPFSLLVEHDHPARDENVLRATKDAINALIGGLDFDVEDEQVAIELILERQLARNDFEPAVRSAERARLLSMRLAEELDRLIRQTRRDLRLVEEEWAVAVPDQLGRARDHIHERLRVERNLLTKIREALTSTDSRLLKAALRIGQLLEECQERHESLHQRVISARGVFLDEQERQAFRPPALLNLPDPHQDVLMPVLELNRTDAETLAERFLVDMWGPRAPRLPRLYRLVNDLWSRHTRAESNNHGEDEEHDLADPPVPLLRSEIIGVAVRAVERVGLPARLSTLISACYDDPQEASASIRQQGAEVLNLAVLWAFSPEDADDDEGRLADDLMATVLGRRTAVDGDGIRLRLPGWDGDDVIVARDPNSLAEANPTPSVLLSTSPSSIEEPT